MPSPSPSALDKPAAVRLRPASRLSAADIAAGIAHLRKVDPTLRRVIDAVGPFAMRPPGNHFHSLARAIVSQQISTHAARTIWARVQGLATPERFTAQRLLLLSDEQLRSAGLSPQKLRYLRDLSSRIADKRLSFARLTRLHDDHVVETLVEVMGIGVWTAQMFLIFSLRRPDVFAPDDLGLRNAIRKLYGLADVPDRKSLHEIAARWAPYRSIASWYLWRSLEPRPQ
jgi:DNA-3-methyladenine glycosylase II